MSDPPYERIKRLVLAAREVPPSERAAHLAAACGGDEDLRREVESLLAHDADAPAFLGPPVADLGRIGPYQLLRVLGEGGMGRVYLAEQTAPIRREVALKLIRRGLDTDRIVARFESERQALAMMDHPGIARVYDAGADEAGRPYFVMERVHGEPITDYCERHRLTTRARLLLFLRVCAAVQHAHQRGLIHRDLKPSNVLVAEQDGRPTPKIIDFGIAKAIESTPGAESLTALGQLVGTPDYMSPEQAGAFAGGVDTRTDVYSLGVLLYELLTGARPYRFDGVGPADVARHIAEAEPARPSAAIARVTRERAGARRASPTQLRRELAGDLDMIVLTALRKEPARRYPSVEALAAEIERHLDGQPIAARPDTWTYRGTKFVRRHRGPVVAGALALVLLGLVGVSYTVRLRIERDRANTARDEAQAVTEFLAGMLRSPDPAEQGRDVTVRSVLERAAAQVERERGARPRIAAQLDEALGRAYHGLGDLALAERHLRRSLEVRERLLGPADPATQEVRAGLGSMLSDAGRYAVAESLARVNLAHVRGDRGDEDPGALLALNAIAHLASYQGRQAEAESLYRHVLAARERSGSADSSAQMNTMALLANLLADQARYAAAESLYVPLLASHRRNLGEDHPRTISAMNGLGLVYMQTARYAPAESLLTLVVASRTRVQGRRHPDTIASLHNLAVFHEQMGRYAQAETLLLEVLDEQRRTAGANAAMTLIVQSRLARVYAGAGQLARAESLLRETLAGRRSTLGPEHVGTLGTQVWLAIVLGREGRTAEAAALFDRTLATQRRVLGPRHTNTLNTAFTAGEFELAAGRAARAEPLLAEATTGVGEAFGEAHPDWTRYATLWGECLTRLRRYEQADSVLRRAWERWSGIPPSVLASPALTARALVALHDAWGKPAEAADWRRRAASAPAGPAGARVSR